MGRALQRGAEQKAEVPHPPNTTSSASAPFLPEKGTPPGIRNRRIEKQRLRHDSRERGCRSISVGEKAAKGPDVGQDPSGDPSVKVVGRPGVQRQLLCAEEGPST